MKRRSFIGGILGGTAAFASELALAREIQEAERKQFGIQRGLSFDRGGVTGELEIDWNDGIFQRVVLLDDTTISFRDGCPDGSRLRLVIKQNETGDHSVQWPKDTKWPNGKEPKVEKAGNEPSIFEFYKGDGSYFGVMVPRGL